MPTEVKQQDHINICKDEGDELIIEALHSIEKGIAVFYFLYIDTLILKSYPMVTAIESKSMNNVCSYCYKSFEKLSRCSKCRAVYYCSRECQKADWYVLSCHSFIIRKFHRVECPYLLYLAKAEDDQVQTAS